MMVDNLRLLLPNFRQGDHCTVLGLGAKSVGVLSGVLFLLGWNPGDISSALPFARVKGHPPHGEPTAVATRWRCCEGNAAQLHRDSMVA